VREATVDSEDRESVEPRIHGRCACGRFHMAPPYRSGETVECGCGRLLRVPLHYTPYEERPWPVVRERPPFATRAWRNLGLFGYGLWVLVVLTVVLFLLGYLLATGLIIFVCIAGLIAQHHYNKGHRAGRAEAEASFRNREEYRRTDTRRD
jgi:hypothetical protein